MPRSGEQLRRDALAIWLSGVEAVRSDRLVRDNVRVVEGRLHIGGNALDLAAIGRIVVVGDVPVLDRAGDYPGHHRCRVWVRHTRRVHQLCESAKIEGVV